METGNAYSVEDCLLIKGVYGSEPVIDEPSVLHIFCEENRAIVFQGGSRNEAVPARELVLLYQSERSVDRSLVHGREMQRAHKAVRRLRRIVEAMMFFFRQVLINSLMTWELTAASELVLRHKRNSRNRRASSPSW
jgi:hypothetical protein